MINYIILLKNVYAFYLYSDIAWNIFLNTFAPQFKFYLGQIYPDKSLISNFWISFSIFCQSNKIMRSRVYLMNRVERFNVFNFITEKEY